MSEQARREEPAEYAATGTTQPRPVRAGLVASLRPRNIPIRLKLLFALVGLAAVSATIVSLTLIRFFQDDKTTYIRDLEADIAANTAASVEGSMRRYGDRLVRMARQLVADRDASAGLWSQLLADPDCVFLGLYDEAGRNLIGLYRQDDIEKAGLSSGDFMRSRQTIAVESVAALVAANSTTSAKLATFALTIPTQGPPPWDHRFLRADYRLAPILRDIRRAAGFNTYILDRQGEVFAHAEEGAMERQTASGPALVARLKTAPVFASEIEVGGDKLLVSAARVDLGGLAVVVERPRRDAYLAAENLTRRSIDSAAFIVLLAVVVAVLLSRSLTSRLAALSAAAASLERGDFELDQHGTEGRDEFAALGLALYHAARGLKERDVKLHDTYESLLQSEKLSAMGKMSAGIVHEIKNPMTSILANAELSQMVIEPDHPVAPRLEVIVQETLRCRDILENLLGFARKDDDTINVFGLHDLVNHVADLMAAQLRLEKVEVVRKLLAEDDRVAGNKSQLTQVLMNLILNAVDAMEGRDTRRITISTASVDERVVVRVRDTGHGIPRDVARRIFDPFFTTKGKGKGTGLGLSVSYGIVTNHGGTIDVTSEPGQWTEFRLALPSAKLAAASNAEAVESVAESAAVGVGIPD